MPFFTSSTQPLCRACGKPIAKHTSAIYFGWSTLSSGSMIETGQARREKPRTRAEAQRVSNKEITSVRWHRETRNGERVPSEDYIDRINVWDGETYEDQFFCSTQCAVRLARACARDGKVLQPYNDAMAARRTA